MFLIGSTQSGVGARRWGLGGRPQTQGLAWRLRCCGRDSGHVGNVMIIGQRLSGEGFAPEDPPPALNQIQPRRSYRNEGVLDAGMGFQPLPDGTTGVAGEVVGNQVEVPARIRAVQRLEQLQIARWCCVRAPSGSAPAHRGPRSAPYTQTFGGPRS